MRPTDTQYCSFGSNMQTTRRNRHLAKAVFRDDLEPLRRQRSTPHLEGIAHRRILTVQKVQVPDPLALFIFEFFLVFALQLRNSWQTAQEPADPRKLQLPTRLQRGRPQNNSLRLLCSFQERGSGLPSLPFSNHATLFSDYPGRSPGVSAEKGGTLQEKTPDKSTTVGQK